MHGETVKNVYTSWWGNYKERYHLEDLQVDNIETDL